jgi:Sulfotransferase domain
MIESEHGIANIQEKGNQIDARFLFIIGAMKSGTTSLFELLSQHPEVCGARVKETDFFASDQTPQQTSEYLKNWQGCNISKQYLLESSVSYAKHPFIKGAPKRISDFPKKSCHFIYMIRNPITRMESQARHAIFAGWGKSLNEEISDDLLAFSKYYHQLEQYLEYFDKSSITIVKLEDFESNPDACLKNICTSLGIDPTFEFTEPQKVRNSGDFFNLPPVLAKFTQSGLGSFISKKVLSKSVKDFLRDKLTRLFGNTKQERKVGRWQFTETEKQKIQLELTGDLNKLSQEFNVNIHDYT